MGGGVTSSVVGMGHYIDMGLTGIGWSNDWD